MVNRTYLPLACPQVNMQKHADDTVLYVNSKNRQLVVYKLTEAMVHVSTWMTNSCLHLNINKTVFLYFSRKSMDSSQPAVLVNGENLKVVSNFRYLGVILDSNFTFKKHVKKVITRSSLDHPTLDV